jgi:membrane dipeptidase
VGHADLAERAAALFEEAIVVDATSPILDRESEWPKWLDGGVTAVMATVATNEDTAGALGQVAAWLAQLRRSSSRMRHATSVADIEQAKRDRRLAVVFHFQNARPLGHDAALVEVFHRLGVRAIQLTYNVKSAIGDGCTERTNSGLSDLGIEVVQEMNRVGVLVDLSHTGVQTTLDAMDVSSDPVIFSHSNARAVCDHPRNLTDEQILGAARGGGVIGLNGFPRFVTGDTDRPTLEHLLRHLDHIVELAGADHVGLGLDYFSTDAAGYARWVDEGLWKSELYPPPPYHYPSGIEDPSRLPALARALLERGYSDEQALKVLGGNFLRVFGRVWNGSGAP